MLAYSRFIAPLPMAGYMIILTYWAGQLGLARSVLLPPPPPPSRSSPTPLHLNQPPAPPGLAARLKVPHVEQVLSEAPTGSRERLDVRSVQSPLKQNPFAALASQSLKQTESAPADPPPTPEAKPPSPAPPPSPARAVAWCCAAKRRTRRQDRRDHQRLHSASRPPQPRRSRDPHDRSPEKHLKSRLGCGGSSDVSTGELLIQGDRPDAVADLLRELGYTVAGITQKPAASR